MSKPNDPVATGNEILEGFCKSFEALHNIAKGEWCNKCDVIGMEKEGYNKKLLVYAYIHWNI